ncbi:MAG: PA2928 family protein [Dokdonella sp.]
MPGLILAAWLIVHLIDLIDLIPNANRLQAALFQTAPVRTDHGGVDRIYFITTQSETIVLIARRGGTDMLTNYLHVDLWAVDAITAKIAWRKRLRRYKGSEISGRILPDFKVFGVDGDTLWVNVEGPLGVSLSDGRVVADAKRIESKNPYLAGRLVLEPGYVAFGRNGLQLTLDDASQWRIDGRDLSAAPRDTPANDPADIVGVADRATSTSRFQLRSLTAGETWLGVLTDAEADELSHPPVIAGRDPNERPGALQQFLNENHVPKALNDPLPQPYRLWQAHVKQVSAAPPDWPMELPDKWGTRSEFSDYKALAESATFLRAGLLRENGLAKVPLWYQNPDSVLLLHFDKLGLTGRLQVTRVSGPLGKPVWNAPLPMTTLTSVMRGAKDLVLWGQAALPGDARRSDDNPEHQQLVRIDASSGHSIALDLTAASLSQEPTSIDSPP